MKSSELMRVRVAFGALGAVPVFLAGWLGWLQVVQGGELPTRRGTMLPLTAQTADRQGNTSVDVPAPRGTILDRNGHTLAADSQVYEVRARLTTTHALRADTQAFRAWLRKCVDGLALALVADPELSDRSERHARLRERLTKQFDGEFRVRDLPASGAFPEKHPEVADVLVARNVDRLAIVSALRALDARRDFPGLSVDFLHSFQRVYPERDLTYGIVGHTKSVEVVEDGERRFETFGACGLEALRALEPSRGTERQLLRDGRGSDYFVAPVSSAPRGNVVHATLDLELQRIAMRELAAEAERIGRQRGDEPEWGALVLVEVATGDVLAAASWHTGDEHPKQGSFTPFQNLFEPGSIVKPLVLAYANAVGALDWENDRFDCKQFGPMYRERIGKLGRARPVTDDHPCEDPTAHGILVNSSNIGASYVGLLLAREQWQDYMRSYGFGKTLGWKLHYESIGGTHRDSFDASRSTRQFRANSAVSFSFGYEMQTTAFQVARAYLRLFRGMGAELRLVRGLDVGGEYHSVNDVVDTSPQLPPEVVERVRRAMVDVVSNDPHATGSHLHRQMLDELGVDLHGLIAGKTGTAASRVGIGGNRMKHVKNASFVGLMPAEEPRWIAVSVLQKDGSARFYGGSYAAPPAVRLLLQCQRLAERRAPFQEPQQGPGGQTRIGLATPGSSGWRDSAGADSARDTR